MNPLEPRTFLVLPCSSPCSDLLIRFYPSLTLFLPTQVEAPGRRKPEQQTGRRSEKSNHQGQGDTLILKACQDEWHGQPAQAHREVR